MRIIINSIIISLITIFICMNILSYHLNKLILIYENRLIKIATSLMNEMIKDIN